MSETMMAALTQLEDAKASLADAFEQRTRATSRVKIAEDVLAHAEKDVEYARDAAIAAELPDTIANAADELARRTRALTDARGTVAVWREAVSRGNQAIADARTQLKQAERALYAATAEERLTQSLAAVPALEQAASAFAAAFKAVETAHLEGRRALIGLMPTHGDMYPELNLAQWTAALFFTAGIDFYGLNGNHSRSETVSLAEPIASVTQNLLNHVARIPAPTALSEAA